eukprot:GHVN01057493.1.p1 GENE.GHVN01057493.1~~GHVN01057493.1.p1  ORF type:complete len:130 (+),score=3.58 GHVN01057493.1:142-531(+)
MDRQLSIDDLDLTIWKSTQCVYISIFLSGSEFDVEISKLLELQSPSHQLRALVFVVFQPLQSTTICDDLELPPKYVVSELSKCINDRETLFLSDSVILFSLVQLSTDTLDDLLSPIFVRLTQKSSNSLI